MPTASRRLRRKPFYATAKTCRLLKADVLAADVLADVKLLSERDVTQTIDSGTTRLISRIARSLTDTDKTQNCSALVHYAGKESGCAATFCFASVRMGI